MHGTDVEPATEFGRRLRDWRQLRRLSQLELGLAASISQRHISWLETGRSAPSRAMILKLSRALDIPLRERNDLLNAAGFAALYTEGSLDGEHMGVVRDALRALLDQQEPYPGMVVDRRWNLVMRNAAARRLLAAAGDEALWERVGDPDHRNVAALMLHPDGLRSRIVNFEDVAPPFVQRLVRDRERSADPSLRAHLDSLIAMAGAPAEPERASAALLPVIPLALDVGVGTLRTFSVIATFGTPQDVTADELRIETLFPADAFSKAFFEGLAHDGG